MTFRQFYCALFGAFIFMIAVSASANTGVLFIGDSLATGLQKPLGAYFQRRGMSFRSVARKDQCVESFTRGVMSAEFNAALATRPEIVIISLGTNDMYAPSRKYAETVRREMVELHRKIESVGASMFVIGPPSMPEKNTLGVVKNVEVYRILMRISPRFFESRELKLPRGDDGIHLVGNAYQVWTQHIVEWLQRG